MTTFRQQLIFGLFGTLLAASTANAASLYGSDFIGQILFQIDENTGSSVAIATGDFGGGLAFNPITQTMYSNGAFTGGNIDTVNLSTGAQTFVLYTGLDLTGLTFSGDFTKLYSLNGNGGSLVSIDLASKDFRIIGPTNVNLLDLATDSHGAVFGGGLGGLFYTVDPSTGATSPVGGSLSWTSIAFGPNDVLYGIELYADGLYTINPADGSATLIGGHIGNDVRGLAYAFAPPASTPIPSTLPLLVTGIGVLGLVSWRRTHRRVLQISFEIPETPTKSDLPPDEYKA
jgi:hypothetical protein